MNPALQPLSRQQILQLIAIMLLVATEFMQNVMVSFSALHISEGIGATPEQFSLSAAVYAGTAIVMIALHKWFVQHWGYRRLIQLSLVLFTVGALVCFSADSVAVFIAGRFVQALGGATFFTASRVQINTFAGRRRLTATRYMVTGIIGFSAIGMFTATWLLTHYSWRWVFIAPLVIVAALTWLCHFVKDPDGMFRKSTLHPGGAMTLAFAAFALQYVLERMPYDFVRRKTGLILLGLLALTGLVLFIRHEYQRKHALLPFDRFKGDRFIAGMVLYGSCYLILSSCYYLLPIFLARGLGLPMAGTGLILGMTSVTALCIAHAHIYLSGKYPSQRKYLVAAFVVLITFGSGMSLIAAGVWPAGWLVLTLGCLAAFASLAQGTAASNTFVGIEEDVFSQAYQTKNMMRELLNSTGISVASIVLHRYGVTHQTLGNATDVMGACTDFFIFVAGLGALGLVVGLWQRKIV
ncbi:MFS transporter [Leeia oryzae]|uniref:MFS transporter n=1 Tax=Leeia oryzae TaxID=356662 RepID=UPI00036D55E7|nr:MFS transporter [Leeia oryzae]